MFLPGWLTAAKSGGLLFGVPKSIISGLNGADAKITIQAMFGQIIFDDMSLDAKLYDDQEEFLNTIRKGELAGAVMRAVDFLKMRAEGAPILGNNLTITGGTSPQVQYVLLGRKQEKPMKLSDFAGKSIILGQGDANLIDQMWLEVILAKEGLPNSDAFFGSKDFVVQTSKALVPLFFGKTDLCLVRRFSWEVMSELNPQLGTQFEVVAESPMLMETLTCLNPVLMNEASRTKFSKRLSGMHLTTSGKSLLTITKVQKFIPFDEEYLEGTKFIVSEHARLFGADKRNSE